MELRECRHNNCGLPPFLLREEVDQICRTVAEQDAVRVDLPQFRKRARQLNRLSLRVMNYSVDCSADGFADTRRRAEGIDARAKIEDVVPVPAAFPGNGEDVATVFNCHAGSPESRQSSAPQMCKESFLSARMHSGRAA